MPATATSTALHDMERKIDQLPLLPQVLLSILQLNSSSDDYFDELEALARQDPPLTVRILAMANCANSAPISPIRTIRDAITRVGATTITRLVASLAVQRVFVPSTPAQLGLWRHSVVVGTLAEHIAARTPALRADKGASYLGGLLHDIGRFVMFEHASQELLHVDEQDWHSPEALIDADMEIFQYTHSELGYLACTHWGLPHDIAQLIRQHHSALPDPVAPGSVDATTLCVQIADRIDILMQGDADGTDVPFDQQLDRECLAPVNASGLIRAARLADDLPSIIRKSQAMLEGLAIA